MPQKPLHTCGYPSCPELTNKTYCDKHKPIHKEYDRRRGSSTERGYNARHRQIREVVRREEPLCRECLKTGQITPSNEMDHIDGNALNTERTNLQMLCKSCHARKTTQEQGGFGHATRIPNDIKPSSIPLTIVCGPPCSGKTMYIDQHKGKDDIVIDLDYIEANLSGCELYRSPMSYLPRALSKRNDMLRSLNSATSGNAWFIVSAPTCKERSTWRDMLQPTRVVLMQVDEYTCIRRLHADNRRVGINSVFINAIKKWWKVYGSDLRDEIVRQ